MVFAPWPQAPWSSGRIVAWPAALIDFQDQEIFDQLLAWEWQSLMVANSGDFQQSGSLQLAE